jgi:hypothetical protein
MLFWVGEAVKKLAQQAAHFAQISLISAIMARLYRWLGVTCPWSVRNRTLRLKTPRGHFSRQRLPFARVGAGDNVAHAGLVEPLVAVVAAFQDFQVRTQAPSRQQE